MKVCGMRDAKNIEEVARLGPDMIGFIFYKSSPRYINNIDTSFLTHLPTSIKKVGVFVNENPEQIRRIVDAYDLDVVQLHGSEDTDTCRNIRKHALVMKAIHVGSEKDLLVTKLYEEDVDYFLFDTRGAHFGGHGIVFDWNILDGYTGKVPFFLSGGLGLQELTKIPSWPKLKGVDINSKFEIEPGLKNIEKVKSAIELVRNGQ